MNNQIFFCSLSSLLCDRHSLDFLQVDLFLWALINVITNILVHSSSSNNNKKGPLTESCMYLYIRLRIVGSFFFQVQRTLRMKTENLNNGDRSLFPKNAFSISLTANNCCVTRPDPLFLLYFTDAVNRESAFAHSTKKKSVGKKMYKCFLNNIYFMHELIALLFDRLSFCFDKNKHGN
jgi:hypothetical protein